MAPCGIKAVVALDEGSSQAASVAFMHGFFVSAMQREGVFLDYPNIMGDFCCGDDGIVFFCAHDEFSWHLVWRSG